MKRSLILLLSLLGLLFIFLIYKYVQKDAQQIAFTNSAAVSRIRITSSDKTQPSLLLLTQNVDKSWSIDESTKVDAEFMKVYFDVLASFQIKSPTTKEKATKLQRDANVKKGKLSIYIQSFIGFHYPAHSFYFYQDSGILYAQKGKNEIIYQLYSPLVDLVQQDYFSTLKDDWRSRKILHFPINRIADIRIEYPLDTFASFTLSHHASSLHIEPLLSNTLDTLKVYDFLSSFTDIYAEYFVNNTLSEQEKRRIFSVPPIQKIKLSDIEGGKIEMDIYLKYNQTDTNTSPDPFMLYAVLPKSRDTLVLSYYMIDRIQRKAAWFFAP